MVTSKNFSLLILQVACETDFVARNELFTNLVASTASSVLAFRQQVIQQNLRVASNAGGDIGDEQIISHLREIVMEHELKGFKHPTLEGVTLEEYVVQLVGMLLLLVLESRFNDFSSDSFC